MNTITNKLFLEKNYISRTSFSNSNPNKQLLSIEYNENGNVTKEIYDNEIVIDIKYDKNNNIILETWNISGEITYTEKSKYEFRDNNTLQKRYFAKFNGPEENSNWQVIEEFDEDGTLIHISKDFEGDGNIDFIEEYNHILGYRTKKIFDANGKIINVQHYEYDMEGNLMSSTFDKDGDGTIEYEAKYQ